MLLFVAVRRIPPVFTLMSETVNHVPIGEALNLTCTAVGSPMPHVRWRKGTTYLEVPSKVPVGRNILNLTDVRETANYTCQAISDLGTIEHTFEVRVVGEQLTLPLLIISLFLAVGDFCPVAFSSPRVRERERSGGGLRTEMASVRLTLIAAAVLT